jgi:hypothetical protein
MWREINADVLFRFESSTHGEMDAAAAQFTCNHPPTVQMLQQPPPTTIVTLYCP